VPVIPFPAPRSLDTHRGGAAVGYEIADRLRARAIAGGRADEIRPGAARRLLHRLAPMLAEQRACWLLRSRPGGLDDNIRQIDRLRHELQRAAAR
jgi:hexosaminidase